MGMFSSLFGKSGSDKADQMRQKAIDAFNSIKSPDLSSLQVQLNDYVNAGKMTPEQAEATLLQSNAFNDIATDPSNTAAQKQALTQLQNISTQGGLTAIDKAQLQDITDTQNQEANSRNASLMQNAQQRGLGNSGLNQVQQMINEQSAADRASKAGLGVAANAQQRALQAIQAAAALGGQMEDRQYGQQADKANAANAIAEFNAQTQNANNLYNTQTANQAQAANLQNQQNINNLNTQTQNENKKYNAQQNQQIFNNELQKAQGVAGTYNGWANEANANAAKDQAANAALTGGLIQAGVSAFGPLAAGAGGATGSTVSNSYKPNVAPNQYASLGYADGGLVTPKDEEDFSNFLKEFKTPKMSEGGKVKEKPKNEIPINYNNDSNSWDVTTASNTNSGTYPSYIEAAQEAERLKGLTHKKMADGGEVDLSTDTAHPDLNQIKEEEDDSNPLKKLAKILSGHADKANDYDKYNQGGSVCAMCSGGMCMKHGGKVPGKAKVAGDSPINDTVDAKLSPGEVVLPRTVVQQPEKIMPFVSKTLSPEEQKIKALRSLTNPNRGGK